MWLGIGRCMVRVIGWGRWAEEYAITYMDHVWIDIKHPVTDKYRPDNTTMPESAGTLR